MPMLIPFLRSLSFQDALMFSFIAVLVICVRSYLRYRRFLSITPPGPPPLPFLGNIFDIPPEQDWLAYADWSKKYRSDLISIRAFGQLSIVVNTSKAAKELFGRRSANYSDKPRLAMLELIEWDWNTGFIRYGDRWRVRRRLLHRGLNVNAVTEFQPVQARYTRKFIASLYLEPKQFTQHIEYLGAGLSLYVAYALEEDEYVQVAKDAFSMLSASIFPGAQLVNAFPILKYVPEWVPGTSYHAFARKSRELTRKMRFDPLAKVKEQMMDGTARPSLTLSMLHSADAQADEEAIADAAAIVFGGGADSTASSLRAAIKAFALHPAVLGRAQAEIDAVIGRDRLPDYTDRSALPYVEAVCREVLRWHAVAPLGAPHASIADDIYDGYFIPRGTTIIWNAWAILHDAEKYQNPHEFKPERWLDEKGQLTGEDLDEAVFGYGKRECAGVHFAKATLWISVASMLSVFSISKAKDKHGDEIEIPMDCTSGLISHPLPFQCGILPRDDKAVELIESLSFEIDV